MWVSVVIVGAILAISFQQLFDRGQTLEKIMPEQIQTTMFYQVLP